MRYPLFLIIIFIFSTAVLFSQNNTDIFSRAMNEYQNRNYSEAYSLFNNLTDIDEIDERLISTSDYFASECLIALNQADGAISRLENLIEKYPNSNYRELSLYRLGSLYFDLKLFDKSREKLVKMVNDYPLSEYSGSAYHLIGESFVEENRMDEAEDFFNSAVLSKLFSITTLHGSPKCLESTITLPEIQRPIPPSAQVL